MKILEVITLFLLLGLIDIQAQTAQAINSANNISAGPYAVVRQDANSRVWQSTLYEPGPNGQTTPHLNSYTELASGLNYQDASGQWQPSKEEIDLQPDGSAAALQGQHQVHFPADILNGTIQVLTPDGWRLSSQPLGLLYYDGTNTAFIAILTNSVGQIVGPNKILYTNAFGGLKADLVCANDQFMRLI